MSRKLYNSLKKQKDQTEQVKLTIYGSLGIPLGGNKVVQVADRQGYVYVRLRDNQNEVIQAFNNKVAASYDLPVIVIREGGRYIVQQFNSQRYLNNSQNSAPFLPGHGTQHSFPRGGGADITWVYGQQIMPGLVYPEAATGTNVMMEKYPLHTDGRWIYAGGTGTQNILQYRPTTGSSSLMTLVYLDALTGNPGILVGSGTYFPATVTGSVYPYLPSPTTTQIPLAGVLLNTGTTVITWENIYDVRQWVHATPSGTSSGGGGGGVDTIGFVGQNKGVYLATGTILNVNGSRLVMSVSGTAFNLTNSPDPYDNIGIYGLSGTTGLGTGTSISFRNGITSSITGTVLFASVDFGTGANQVASGNRGVTNGDSHDHSGGDGAQISHLSLSNIGSTSHATIDGVLSDAWTPYTGTWTYASASTFTITGDVASQFTTGLKIKWTQTSVKYGVVLSASYSAPNTTVTIAVNTDYTIANSAIVSPHTSRAISPSGYPEYFNFTPSWTNVTVGNGTVVAKYSIQGRQVDFEVSLKWGTTTSYGGSVGIAPPITAMDYTQAYFPIGNCGLIDWATALYMGAAILQSTTSIEIRAIAAGGTYATWTNVSPTVPHTWANTDLMTILGRYFIT